MRRNKMWSIRNLRIGDIIAKENKYEGYKYSIVEGIDNISGTIRHREVYEDGGRQMAISSWDDMTSYPLSVELLKAHGWQKSLNGMDVLFRDFKTVTIGLRKTELEDEFCPILLPVGTRRMSEAMIMYCIDSVNELQALLDIFWIDEKIKP